MDGKKKSQKIFKKIEILNLSSNYFPFRNYVDAPRSHGGNLFVASLAKTARKYSEIAFDV